MKGIKYNVDGLKKVRKNLASKMVVKVGVLSGHTSRTTKPGQDDIDNATLGAKMELGMPAEKIPPRSWLEIPLKDNFKDYFVKANFSTELAGNSMKSFMDSFIGKTSVAVIHKGFETGGYGKWARNSDITIALKGSDKPLRETDQLMESISSRVVNG